MAVVTRVLVASLLVFSLLLLNLAEAERVMLTSSTTPSTGTQSPPPKITIACGEACDARCQLSSRPRLCKRACGTCCFRCQCVPPGTYGNYDACPCYANMTTHGNRHKCP